MRDFIRIDTEGAIQPLQLEPFADGVNELRNYISENPAMLGGNVVTIVNQLDIGIGKPLDILALEEISEGIARPVIVEIKDVQADTSALLQVMRYVTWVLNHTDSVRNHAGQSKTKFKDIDNSSIKVIIVSPDIKDELVELSNYVISDIVFRFLEYKHFKDAAGSLLVLDWKTPTVPSGLIPTAQKEWDWDKYQSDLKISSERIFIAKHLFDRLVRLNSEKEWGLAPVFRKLYIPFKKSGNYVVQIEIGTKPCLVIGLPQKPKELGLPEIHPELEQDYDDKYSQYWFQINDTSIDVTDFSEYIEKAIEML